MTSSTNHDGVEDQKNTEVAFGPQLEEVSPPTGSTSVTTRAELRRRKRRRKLIARTVAGGTVLLLAAAGGYYAFGTATIPQAQGQYAELSSDDPCEEFKSLATECSVSFEHSDSIDRDMLIGQNPEPGFSAVRPGSIELTYSSGPAESEFPDILRQDYEDALEELYPIGIEVGEITTVERDDLGPNRIVSSSIEAGAVAESGSKVNLEVSAETVNIPDLTGLTREQAELDLQALGFDPEILEEDSVEPVGTVIGQTPAPGTAAKGSQVTVSIARAEAVETLEVPTVIGLTEEEAQGIVASAGFRNIAVVKVESSKVTEPRVSHVAPGEGRMIRSDSNVVIVISIPEQ